MADATYTYSIADFLCGLTFVEGQGNDISLLPSYVPFRVAEASSSAPFLFSLLVDDTLTPWAKGTYDVIITIADGVQNVRVAQRGDGSYEFIICTLSGEKCCLLHTTSDFTACQCALRGTPAMRSYGLNNALMMAYAFAASARQTLLMHASVVRHDGWAYPFIAKSGTGKSTHTNLWLSHVPACDLLNDDNPVLRIVGDDVLIYGSPWSGKTACYRQTYAPAGAITKIVRADHNAISPTPPVDAFVALLSACSTMKWDSTIYNNICSTISSVVERLPLYTLYCLPTAAAAKLCHQTIARHK